MLLSLNACVSSPRTWKYTCGIYLVTESWVGEWDPQRRGSCIGVWAQEDGESKKELGDSQKRDEETPRRKSVLREVVNVYSRVWWSGDHQWLAREAEVRDHEEVGIDYIQSPHSFCRGLFPSPLEYLNHGYSRQCLYTSFCTFPILGLHVMPNTLWMLCK